MARPLPEWLPRALAMRAGEVIIIDSDLTRQTVKYHVGAGFQVRETQPGQFRIARK